ncbi:restriction endonuclease subunit S [Lactobacillus delbrueckii subsp. bulgaricus]|uniref:restriction endonuclease subunit S n=1 Tax=Lactobacillus delbrueckii TaxID=1584 RepID=UPI001E2B0451|nr:restriction endonuclease subunit S [Lactobacillus delbrueckii subsp. bulgaricus]MCD5463965.1 restriction endonuclease subunit S [Lactobacillus delbrueckii subsp. bulgaricus]MCD5479706.1 restriction endonuclease subunit S [Lactobacillus delbrueckii subsp. bulgaricus]
MYGHLYSGNTPSRKKSANFGGDTPWIRTADLNNGLIKSATEFLTYEGIKQLKILPENTIVLAMYGGFNQIGRTGILGFPATINQALVALTPHKNINQFFAQSYLNRHIIDWRRVAASSRKDPNITKEDVEKSEFSFGSLEEQNRISKLISRLDHTITLHEEKKRQLERLKSALLQKMFADKSGYPPVRFEGFSDKWEQVKYGEIFQRRSKMGVSTPTLPSVEYDDINPGMGTLNKEPKSKGISKRGIYFNPGDVLFGKLRPYLKNWLFACFEGVAVGDFWVLTSSKIDHGFTYSLIQTPGFQYIANLSSGSKMPRSDWGLVSNARTFIPINHLEQERISSVLFGLDHAITLYEHKLEILNKIKSFLLQNMFI